MRIAHLSDLHLTEGPRLDDQAQVLGRVVADVVTACPDLVIIAGDLAGRTVPHRTTPREREILFPALVQLATVAPVVVVYGNHDQAPDLDTLRNLDGQWPVLVLAGAGADTIATPAGPLALYWLAYPSKRWLLASEQAQGVADAQRQVEARLGQLFGLWASKIRRQRRLHPDLCHVFVGHVQVSGSRTSGGEVLAGQEIEVTRDQLDGLGVDYGALGHLHRRQEAAPRIWYSGSPWRNDYAETEPSKAWNLVDLGVAPADWTPGTLPPRDRQVDAWDNSGDGRQLCRGFAFDTGCRPRVTLEYRWADYPGPTTRPAGWTRNPWLWSEQDSEELAQAVAGADVRMRLTVPQQWAASCPWDQEQERVRQLGAYRIDVERVIEPVLRVRAPAVAQALTLADKVSAFWTTTATALTEDERQAALACLHELETTEDEQINPTGDRHDHPTHP